MSFAFEPIIPFDTPRLHVREFLKDDAPILVAMAMRDPDFTFFRLKTLPETSEDEVIRNAAMLVSEAADNRNARLRNLFMLAVCLRNHSSTSSQLIGYVALGDAYDDDKRDIGYLIDPDRQGRGYATEATQGLMEQFFNVGGANYFRLTVHPDNIASIHVARKLGFKQVGQTETIVCGQQQPRLKFLLKRDDFACTPQPPS